MDEIRVEDLDKMGMTELIALRQWTLEPTEDGLKGITLARFSDLRTKLKRDGIPKEEWPDQLKSPDWLIAVREEMGLEPMTPEMLTHYLECEILVEMFGERERLKVQGVPESEWPPELSGADWAERIYIKYGLPPQKWPSAVPPHPQVEGKGFGDQPMTFGEPRTKPKPTQKTGDPFSSDKFGTLAGEMGDSQVDEILREKRERQKGRR